MHGDFSRLTFDPHRGYRSVLLQQGRVLLDADWNEQAAITAYEDAARTRSLLGAHGGIAGEAGFGVVDADGKPAVDVPWQDLHLSPGPYYVDGVRYEARRRDGADTPVELADQPHLPPTDTLQVTTATDGTRLLYLDAWTRQVTADEDRALQEPALGGPDTTTRAATVWQVRTDPIGATDPTSRGTMTASLTPGVDDPAGGITTSGGYTLLDNQLYRVQIHEGGDHPTFLWSRENGSVVAALQKLTVRDADSDSELVVDRTGRDDTLSIGAGSVVEVTSTDRELLGTPGFLAVVGRPDGLSLPVRWLGTPPTTLEKLGSVPLVRRWDARQPQPTTTGPTDIEGGIQVSFPGGTYRTGDYWLIPARAVQMAYGQAGRAGTIDWPRDPAPDGGPPRARPLQPHGPVHHVVPIAVLSPSDGEDVWSLDTDLRRLATRVTEMFSLDVVGGDAQEAPPGQDLPFPVRVAVRNGGRPVPGATLRFTPDPGGTVNGGPTAAVVTGEDGTAAVIWRLDRSGRQTQSLTAAWLDEDGVPIRPAVIATGRLGSSASGQVMVTVNAALTTIGAAWTSPQRGRLQAPTAVAAQGWMPVLLPHGYRLVSMIVVADKAANTQLNTKLFREFLGPPPPGVAVQDNLMNVTIPKDVSGRVNQPLPLIDAAKAVINTATCSYYVTVDTGPAPGTTPTSGDTLVMFQILCEWSGAST